MKSRRMLSIGGLSLLLGACQYLPQQGATDSEQQVPSAATCRAEEPTFDNEACLLPSWVAFGLASQRGDGEWRTQALEHIDTAHHRSETERELARAVVLAWGSEGEWQEAAALYEAHTHAAPADLQQLLRYWRNELEGRRSLASQNATVRNQVASLQREKAELSEKLEALTAIEQNMNSRQ